MTNKTRFLLINTAIALLFASAIAAEGGNHDLHSGDIQPWRVGAEIFVNSSLFEADFGDLSGGSFATDEPGVDVNIAEGTFTPGNWLRFKPVGQLLFWSGTEWVDSMPNGERIEITDALENIISFSGNAVSETAGIIGAIGSDGGLHEHISFKIFDATNTPNGTPGAYRIQLKLFESQANDDTSISIAASPIAIVFNRGLDHESFESAVTAAGNLAENAVFVSETGILTIQRVKALGTNYQVKLRHIGDSNFQLIEVNEVIGGK